MQQMQASIPDTRAFNQFTTAMAPYRVFNRRTSQFVTVRNGFDVGAGGVLGSLEVPEPGAIVLVAIGFGVMVIVRAGPRRRPS